MKLALFALASAILVTACPGKPGTVPPVDSAAPYCGDGILDPGEECDDGDLNTDEVVGACKTNCRIQVCGNGQYDPGELCDDGNLDPFDSCPADCGASLDGCGNGIVDTGEQCDDANENNWDGCTLVCQSAEFRVNTRLEEDQAWPEVAVAPDGRFAVFWNDSSPSLGTVEIHGALFDARRTSSSTEFFVSGVGYLYFASLAAYMTEDGRFSVAWRDKTTVPSWSGVLKRDFTGLGRPMQARPVIVSNFLTLGHVTGGPEMAGAPGGRHVVAWPSSNASLGHNGIYFQLYDDSFTADGSELLAAETPEMDLILDVAMSSEGAFIVVWHDLFNIWGRKFAPDGQPEGPEFLLAQGDWRALRFPKVGLADDGRFAVSWSRDDDPNSGHDHHCYFRVFEGQGTAVSPATECFPADPADSGSAFIAMRPDGSFALLWYLADDIPAEHGVMRQGGYVSRFSRDGTPVGFPEKVSLYDKFIHLPSSVGIATDGSILVVSTEYYCCNHLDGQQPLDYPPDVNWDYDVYARLFDTPW